MGPLALSVLFSEFTGVLGAVRGGVHVGTRNSKGHRAHRRELMLASFDGHEEERSSAGYVSLL